MSMNQKPILPYLGGWTCTKTQRFWCEKGASRPSLPPPYRLMFQDLGDESTLLFWWFQTWLDYFPFHIWDVILPIDELHHFSRWLLHHQPVLVSQVVSTISMLLSPTPAMLDGDELSRCRNLTWQSGLAIKKNLRSLMGKPSTNGWIQLAMWISVVQLCSVL